MKHPNKGNLAILKVISLKHRMMTRERILNFQNMMALCYSVFFMSVSSLFICRYKMISLTDISGRKTALVALRNCLYLIPVGYLAYQCE